MELFTGFNGRLTIENGFELLWRYHLKNKPSGKTYLGNRKALCRSFGGRYLDTITFVDVEAHKATRPKGAAFHDHGVLSLLYNKLAEWKRRRFKTADYDFSEVKLPFVIPTVGVRRGSPGVRNRVVTPAEFARFAEHAPQQLLDIVIIRLDTGLRGTDIERLTPTNLNHYNREIEIEQSKTRRRVSIPASKRVIEIFERAEKEGRNCVCNFHGLVYWWNKVRRDAKLPGIQLRDFRRTGPSWAYDKFPDFNALGELLGHADPRSTRRYVVIRRGHLRKIVKYIEEQYCEK